MGRFGQPGDADRDGEQHEPDLWCGEPAFTASYSGFVNGDTAGVVSGSPGLTTAATAVSPVGGYTITNTIGSFTRPITPSALPTAR